MKFFVYKHIRLDKNEVFYIGIGQDEKRPYWKYNRNRYWNYITKKTDYKVEVIYKNLSRNEAEQKEKELILKYGRKDKNWQFM